MPLLCRNTKQHLKETYLKVAHLCTSYFHSGLKSGKKLQFTVKLCHICPSLKARNTNFQIEFSSSLMILFWVWHKLVTKLRQKNKGYDTKISVFQPHQQQQSCMKRIQNLFLLLWVESKYKFCSVLSTNQL